MNNIVGIQFNKKGKTYNFSAGKLELNKGEKVVVQTERGMQVGEVIDFIKKPNKIISSRELKSVVRKAGPEDIDNDLQNKKEANDAIIECEKLVKKYNINMKIISAEYTLDKNQLLFYFYSDQRVDFRSLARDLAMRYKTRIELRQIGPRDKAKEVGGKGICGRNLCCSEFLDNLDAVSINMAKNQNLALNPTKINGACGRLLCCLRFENELYEKNRKRMPEVGEIIRTKKGKGKVIAIDILTRSYKVVYNDNEVEIISMQEKK